MIGRRWYVAQTEPKKERLAVVGLERQSFLSLCPCYHKIRRHARRIETVLAPLFPGYVFVNFDLDKDSWRSINGTLGVRRLISFDPVTPLPMPDEAMIPLLNPRGDSLGNAVGGVQVGGTVRMISGPFAEQLATVETLDDKGRIRLLFDILGSAVRLRLRVDGVVPVTP